METEPSPSAYGMCKAFVFPHSQSQLVSDYEQGTGRDTSGLAGSLPRVSSFHHWPSLVPSPTLPGTHTASLVTQHAEPASNVFSVSTCPKSLAGKFPLSWSRSEVADWVWWCMEEYALGGVEPQRFSMNGKALCLLTKDGFQHRAPYAGDVLYELLQKALSTRPHFYQSSLSMQMGTSEAAKDTISLARHLCSTTTAINVSGAKNEEDEKEMPRLVLPLPLNLKKIAAEGPSESSSDSGCSSQDNIEETKEPTNVITNNHQGSSWTYTHSPSIPRSRISSPSHHRSSTSGQRGSPLGQSGSPGGHLRSLQGQGVSFQRRSSPDHDHRSSSRFERSVEDDRGSSPQLRSPLHQRGSPFGPLRSPPGQRSPSGQRRSPPGQRSPIGREGRMDQLRRSPPELDVKGSSVVDASDGCWRNLALGSPRVDPVSTTTVLTDRLCLARKQRLSSSTLASHGFTRSDVQPSTAEASPSESENRQMDHPISNQPYPDNPSPDRKPVISTEDKQNSIQLSSGNNQTALSPRDTELRKVLEGRTLGIWKEEASWKEGCPNQQMKQERSHLTDRHPATEKVFPNQVGCRTPTEAASLKFEKEPGFPDEPETTRSLQGVTVIRNGASFCGVNPSCQDSGQRDVVITSASRRLSEYAAGKSPLLLSSTRPIDSMDGFPKVPSGFLTQTLRQTGKACSLAVSRANESGFQTGRGGSCHGKAACRFLWDFLAQLLEDEAYAPYICWKDKKKRIFRFLKPDVVATLWGLQKNRARMSYEKMSRSMRYYYKTDILCKVPGEKLTYRFLQDPADIGNTLHSAKLKKKTGPDTTAEGAVASQEATTPTPDEGHGSSDDGDSVTSDLIEEDQQALEDADETVTTETVTTETVSMETETPDTSMKRKDTDR